ncbi:hypothetical protein [Leptolyngbya ohadii]|uniref:GspE/PulE/PilB domain-containing protein n=1 Tax=Leptolyngbya ohadii TaxID=1962290 RepID=UPI000B59C745|nr:hypothetical protein [Leptolyngbya ohadii]
MAAPPDDRTPSPRSDRSQQRILSQFYGDWVDRLNLDQMFVLINGVLPFEACLYYQVLPLFLDGNRLNLGMVSPEDTTAADYVRRIISYLNYSLVTRKISADALQSTLTAYLNEVEKKQNHLKNQLDASEGSTVTHRVSFGHHRHAGRNRVAPSVDQNERLTLVVDSPDELEEMEGLVEANPGKGEPTEPLPQPPQAPVTAEPQQPTLPPVDTEPSSNVPVNAPVGSSVKVAKEKLQAPEKAKQEPEKAPKESGIPRSFQPVVPLISQLPVLHVQAEHLSSPTEALLTLPPHIMLQELLARVLIGGIGRLYFENHGQYGRILWSQNGILQSVLENVPIALFHEILAALKQLAKVTSPIQTYPRQTEAEYLYEKSRVLLRFRFMVNEGIEEATLQILRGAALKFHQQQQMRKLERDAVGIAKQLQVKLNEIRDRAQKVGGLASSRFDVLPGLSDVLRRIEEQLDELGVSPSDSP